MLSKQLGFDTTDANTIAASDNVGAFLRAINGDLIGDKTISASKWLQVASALFDGSGTALTSTAVSGSIQALDVNLASPLTVQVDLNGVYNVSTNPSPDNTGLVGASRAASPAASGQSMVLTAGEANADGVTAANVWGLDVNSFLMGYNGTSWDRLHSTSGALNVNLSSTSVNLSVSDLVDSTVKPTNISVGTSAVAVAGTSLASRKRLFVQNLGNRKVYVGDSGVTTSNGTLIGPGGSVEIAAGPSLAPYVISDAAAQDVRVLELS